MAHMDLRPCYVQYLNYGLGKKYTILQPYPSRKHAEKRKWDRQHIIPSEHLNSQGQCINSRPWVFFFFKKKSYSGDTESSPIRQNPTGSLESDQFTFPFKPFAIFLSLFFLGSQLILSPYPEFLADQA